MDKLWVYDGVAYHSRDLAILHGADELSLYPVYFNDTLDDDIEIEVEYDKMTITESYDTIEIPTEHRDDWDYFDIDFSTRLLSTDMKDRIKDKIADYIDDLKWHGYDEEIDDKV
jgi:hypothetical protein